jgi:hypothetical protein
VSESSPGKGGPGPGRRLRVTGPAGATESRWDLTSSCKRLTRTHAGGVMRGLGTQWQAPGDRQEPPTFRSVFDQRCWRTHAPLYQTFY